MEAPKERRSKLSTVVVVVVIITMLVTGSFLGYWAGYTSNSARVNSLKDQLSAVQSEIESLQTQTKPVVQNQNEMLEKIDALQTQLLTIRNQIDSLQALFCDQGAALVIYNDFPTQFRNQVGEAELGQLPKLFEGLSAYGKYSDGTIYLCH